MSFNTRDMWEHQVELLTRHCQSLNAEAEQMQKRVEYLEGVVFTLLTALVDNGVIRPDTNEGDTQTYEF